MTEYKPAEDAPSEVAEALDELDGGFDDAVTCSVPTDKENVYQFMDDESDYLFIERSYFHKHERAVATLRRALKPQAQPQEDADTPHFRSDGQTCFPYTVGSPCRDSKCPDRSTSCPKMAPVTPPPHSREALLEAKADMLEALVHQRVRERDWLATTLAHADAAFFGLIPSQGKRTPEEWIRLASSNAALATLSTTEEAGE